MAKALPTPPPQGTRAAVAREEDVPTYDHAASRVPTCAATDTVINKTFVDSAKYSRAVVVRAGDARATKLTFQAHHYDDGDTFSRTEPLRFELDTAALGSNGITEESLLKCNDSRMMLLTSAGSIGSVDLETGKVVATFDSGFEGAKAEHMCHSAKFWHRRQFDHVFEAQQHVHD